MEGLGPIQDGATDQRAWDASEDDHKDDEDEEEEEDENESEIENDDEDEEETNDNVDIDMIAGEEKQEEDVDKDVEENDIENDGDSERIGGIEQDKKSDSQPITSALGPSMRRAQSARRVTSAHAHADGGTGGVGVGMGLDMTPLAERRRATELLRASGVTITSQRTSLQSHVSSYRMHMSRAIGSSLNAATPLSSSGKAQGTTGASHAGTGAYTARNSISASEAQTSSSVLVSGSGSSSGTSGTFKTAIEDGNFAGERPLQGITHSGECHASPAAPKPKMAGVRSERRKTELFVDPATGWRSIRTSPSTAARATQAQGSAIV